MTNEAQMLVNQARNLPSLPYSSLQSLQRSVGRTQQLLGQGTGVIDRFLDVFTRYIDSGFGLLQGEVAWLASTLIVIDVTLAALF